EVQVVAQHVVLRQLRQVGRRGPAHRRRHEIGAGLVAGRRDDRPAPAGRAELHHERLVPAGGGGGLPHRVTPRSAVARRSTSSDVCTSVTQYSALWPSQSKSAERSLPPKMPWSSSARLISTTVLPVPSKRTTNSLKNPSG